MALLHFNVLSSSISLPRYARLAQQFNIARALKAHVNNPLKLLALSDKLSDWSDSASGVARKVFIAMRDARIGVTVAAELSRGTAMAMTPLERQHRRRAKLKAEKIVAERAAQAEFLAACHAPELDQCRRNIGRAAAYIASLGNPETVARMVIESQGPRPPAAVLRAAATWLDRFATATLYAGALAE